LQFSTSLWYVSFDLYNLFVQVRPTLVGVAGLVICLNSQWVSFIGLFSRINISFEMYTFDVYRSFSQVCPTLVWVACLDS